MKWRDPKVGPREGQGLAKGWFGGGGRAKGWGRGVLEAGGGRSSGLAEGGSGAGQGPVKRQLGREVEEEDGPMDRPGEGWGC